MSAPKRIQRQRTKGWRMPEGAVYVGRPSRWGNPWAASVFGNQRAVDRFRAWLDGMARMHPTQYATLLDPLRGHDLACWCPLDQPCHGDTLLELANR